MLRADSPREIFKYQGTGNDFIILDERAAGVNAAPPPPAWVTATCHRHTGVGADGVLTVLPAPPGVQASARMHVTNADGSVPEMCGNGLRCVALFLVDQQPALRALDALVVHTDAGLRTCQVQGRTPGAAQVRLGMGPVRFGADAALPADTQWTVAGAPVPCVAVSVGNPHLVLQSPPPALDHAQRLGPALASDPAFAAGTNVEWVAQRNGGLEVLVFERGAGLTQACGTGAVASAFAAQRWGWVRLDGQGVGVHLPGGTVTVSQDPDGTAVLTGPAVRVFRAQLG